MAQLTLINPLPKRRRKNPGRKHRSAAQKAATRKLVALMRAKRAGKRRRKNPLTHVNLGANMAKRRHRRHNPVRHHRRHHNPISFKRVLSNPVGVIMPAAVGAFGALAVNGAINYIPYIPAKLKTGNYLYLTKGALAIALAAIASKIPKVGKHAAKMAEGSLTCTLADLGKTLAMNAGWNLSGTGFVSPASVMTRPSNVTSLPRPQVAGMGQYVNGANGMRMYVNGRR